MNDNTAYVVKEYVVIYYDNCKRYIFDNHDKAHAFFTKMLDGGKKNISIIDNEVFVS